MIYLGLSDKEKQKELKRIKDDFNPANGVIFSPSKFAIQSPEFENVGYTDIIKYRYFYRLLNEIDKKTIVVVNECMRTQNRNDLTYNCLRHYIHQAGLVVVFQWLPIIENDKDFFILFDFDTDSKHRKGTTFEMCRWCDIRGRRVEIKITPKMLVASKAEKEVYKKKKNHLFANIGVRDPNIIPRQLHLVAGKAKLRAASPFSWYIGRNNRYKIENIQKYKDNVFPNKPYTVFEFCHNHIRFSDFLYLAGQTEITAMASDLPVDLWYLDRYQAWSRKIEQIYSKIQF